MTDNYDSKWTFTDKQGETFYVWAGSESEAWRLAKAESNHRDAEYKANVSREAEDREARHQRHSELTDAIIRGEVDAIEKWAKGKIEAEEKYNGLEKIPGSTEYVSESSFYNDSTMDANARDASQDVSSSSSFGCFELAAIAIAAIIVIGIMLAVG